MPSSATTAVKFGIEHQSFGSCNTYKYTHILNWAKALCICLVMAQYGTSEKQLIRYDIKQNIVLYRNIGSRYDTIQYNTILKCSVIYCVLLVRPEWTETASHASVCGERCHQSRRQHCYSYTLIKFTMHCSGSCCPGISKTVSNFSDANWSPVIRQSHAFVSFHAMTWLKLLSFAQLQCVCVCVRFWHHCSVIIRIPRNVVSMAWAEVCAAVPV